MRCVIAPPHRSPWHSGELELQRAADVAPRMEALGQRMIRTYMPDQHRQFFAQLPFIVLSALDLNDQVWPFILAGPAGFAASPSPTRLRIRIHSTSGYPSESAMLERLRLGVGDKVSVLGIQFETRRRNRLNGTIKFRSAHALEIEVDQSYGNCPRYIHIREQQGEYLPGPIIERQQLSTADQRHIQRADTLFIASRTSRISRDPRDGIDVNHRGGLPGFIKMNADGALIIPDYDGNKFFNTLGNILRDPRAGLLLPDFETGDLLSLVGTAEVIADDPVNAAHFGSHRYLKFSVDMVRLAVRGFPYRYALRQRSSDPPHPSS